MTTGEKKGRGDIANMHGKENRSGRKPGSRNVKTVEREKLQAEWQKMLDGLALGAIQGLAAIAERTKDEKLRADIYVEIINRTMGRPRQAVDLSGKIESEMTVNEVMTADEKGEILRRLSKAYDAKGKRA